MALVVNQISDEALTEKALISFANFGLPIDILEDAVRGAIAVKSNAYQPWVKTAPQRGVAVIANGQVFFGTDVQNAATPSSFSAGAIAVREAVFTGNRDIETIFVYGDFIDGKPYVNAEDRGSLEEFSAKTAILGLSPGGDTRVSEYKSDYPSLSARQNNHYPDHRESIVSSLHLPATEFLALHSAADLSQFFWNFPFELNEDDFLECAKQTVIASSCAYDPHCKYPVGSAIITQSGEIFPGCNVQTMSLGGSMCAERTAIGIAACKGELKNTEFFEEQIKFIMVYVPQTLPAASCCECRQSILEFTNKAPVVSFCESGEMVYAEAVAAEGAKLFTLNAAQAGGIVIHTEEVTNGLVPAPFSPANLKAAKT
jgi:cytidine deaminase